MSLLKELSTNNELRMLYLEKSELEKLRNGFERYVFSLYKKVLLVQEIRTKIEEIEHGIEEHRKDFARLSQDDFQKRMKNLYKKGYENDIFYYKRWVAQKIKQIRKLFYLELKSNYSLPAEKNIIDCIEGIISHLNNKTFKEEKSEFKEVERFKKTLEKLKKNISSQMKHFDVVFPFNIWTKEKHREVIPKVFIKLLGEELELVFGDGMSKYDVEMYPVLIKKFYHENKFPSELMIAKLLKETNEKISLNKKSEDNRELIKVYHSRPRHLTWKVFPLTLLKHIRGFYVSFKARESALFVRTFYDLRGAYEDDFSQIEVFEITIPKNLFDRISMSDPKAGYRVMGADEVKLDNSFIIKPSHYHIFNEYEMKRIITWKRLSSGELRNLINTELRKMR